MPKSSKQEVKIPKTLKNPYKNDCTNLNATIIKSILFPLTFSGIPYGKKFHSRSGSKHTLKVVTPKKPAPPSPTEKKNRSRKSIGMRKEKELLMSKNITPEKNPLNPNAEYTSFTLVFFSSLLIIINIKIKSITKNNIPSTVFKVTTKSDVKNVQ